MREPGELVDRARLGRFLAERVPSFAGPFRVERLGEGQSNLTFLLRGKGWEAVLRRPPRGELPPTAHDVRREYRVMRALSDARASVPVPRPLVLCEDREVIGAPFYLMEKVHGVVVRRTLPPELSNPPDREQMGDEMVDTLVALHEVNPAAVGLADFGKPEGFPKRQLRRMRGLWDLARFRDLPDLDRAGRWLADHVPPQAGTAIVHGDYKLDNAMFAPASPARLVAVVDWELSTLGDPLADLGWLLYFWREAGEPSFGLPVGSVTDQPGFPRRRALLERYVAASGRSAEDIRWYVALAGWKIAIIMEGSYGRYRHGVADHPSFADLDWVVPGLAHRAVAAISGELEV